MNWFDEVVRSITYPLRATLADKVLIVAQLLIVSILVAIGIISLVSWLCE